MQGYFIITGTYVSGPITMRRNLLTADGATLVDPLLRFAQRGLNFSFLLSFLIYFSAAPLFTARCREGGQAKQRPGESTHE